MIRKSLLSVLLLLCAGLLGCGPLQEILDEQEEQLQKMIEEAQTNPPNMTPEEREMRRGRLEMDFGIEAVDPK